MTFPSKRAFKAFEEVKKGPRIPQWTQRALEAAYEIDLPHIQDAERRKIVMQFNTQYMTRRIDQIIKQGGDSGEVLNFIADFIRSEE